MRFVKLLLAAVAATCGIAGTVRAQNVVPGGWSTQVGYQALGASGQGAYSTASPYYGWNNAGSGAVVVSPGYGQNWRQPAFYPQPPRMINDLGGFGGVVGRTTRPRRSR